MTFINNKEKILQSITALCVCVFVCSLGVALGEEVWMGVKKSAEALRP